MELDTVRELLLWSTILNFAILLAWTASILLGNQAMQRLHAQWFHLTVEQAHVLHFGGIIVYKIGITLFNLVPLIALWIIE